MVSYGFDGYEGKKPEDVEEKDFDRTNYSKKINQSGARIDSNKEAYKIITSENWSIVFPLTDEDRELYNGKSALKVRFTDYSMTGAGQLFHLHRQRR